MTQMPVAPPVMPAVAPAPAAAAGAEAPDPAQTAGEGDVDFAAVLKAKMGQPAKDGSQAENLAAVSPMPAADTEEMPAAASSFAPDLASLLPGLAGLQRQPGPAQPAASSADAAGPVPALTAAAASAALTAAPLLGGSAQAPSGEATTSLTEQAAFASAAASLLPSARPAAAAAAKSEPVGVAAALAEQPARPAETAAAVAAAPATAEGRLATADPRMPAVAAEQAAAPALEHSAAPMAHAGRASDTPAAMRIETPVGSRGWDAEVGQKIVLLASRQESRAELTLTPPQLGRVEITLSMSGDQTSATFVSASPAAREALEQALPRLREILAEAGITLGQANVNAESESAQRGNEEPRAHGRGAQRDGHERPAMPAAQWVQRGNGLIDTFA